MNEAPRPQFEDVNDVVRYQLSRRSLVGGGAAAAMTAFLAACSGGGSSYSDKPANNNKPVATKSIRIGKANIPVPRDQAVIVGQVEYTVFDSFNGMIPNGSPGGAGVELSTEPLFYLSFATGEMKPWLATEYKYNDDFTEVTFKFDPKAHWNDGKPLGAADFKFTIMLLKDRPDLFGGGGELKEFVKAIDVPDPQTAVVKLLKPTPRFHYNFISAIAGPPLGIMPEHIWKTQDPTKYKDNPPVHSGPYKLKQAIRNQKMFVWEKDPNYWNKDKLDVKPQYVVFQSTSKQLDQASLAFERAEFDVGSVDEQHAKQLRNTGYPALQTTQFHDPNPRVMWLNCDPSRGVISEPKMRWAINYCLDREKIGKSIWPVPVPPAQYPWADYPTNDKWKDDEIANKYKFEFSPEKATQLLDEIAPKNAAGKRTYKGKEINLEIITPSPVDGGEYAIANVLKTELAKVGVPATLRSLAGNVHDEKFQRGQYDIDSSWAGIAIDPEQLYTDWTSDKYQPIGKNAAGKNKLRFRNAKFDEISKKLAGLNPESEEAKPLLKEALEIYFQELPMLSVIQTGYPSYFNTTFWKGWPTDEDLYEVPLNWWQHFIFVLGKIEPTGQKGPA